MSRHRSSIKKLKNTSQKSTPSYGTVILQKPSFFHGNFSLESATGVQQSDPLGPALFTLAIHEVTSKIKADLNIWYLDDGYIGGDPQTMLTNATMIRDSLSLISLEINNSKCELLLINHTDINKPQTSKLFQDQFPSLSIPDPILWQLLGSPPHQESAPLYLKAKIKVLDSITENLELIEPHQAFFILKNCLSIPKLAYLLRSSAPCFKCKEELEAFDTAIRINTEKISSVTFGKNSWSQPSLPIRHGGLSLHYATDLSLPCFLSSSFAYQGLVNRLLPSFTLPHGEVINATDAWSALHDSSPRQNETQSAWDDLACRDSLAALLDSPSPWNHCRLLTAQKCHTAAWSTKAFPNASVGNQLSPNELRIAIALRTGANIFESTECRCGKFVDRLGFHGLSCITNAGRFPRHSAINSILKRSLTRIVVSPLSLSTLAWWKIEGPMVWPWTPGTEAGALYGTRQLWTPLQKVTTVGATIPGSVSNWCWDRQMSEIQWPSWQLLLSTSLSCNRNHWCVRQVHCPLLELSRKQIRWHFRQPQGATVAPPVPVSGRGQREHRQHIGLCASLIGF